jgi:hypothetical protein
MIGAQREKLPGAQLSSRKWKKSALPMLDAHKK